jgi:hypothetical protein
MHLIKLRKKFACALCAVGCVLLMGGAHAAYGLSFNITYDTTPGDQYSLAGYQYLSQAQTAVNAVAAEFSADFSNPITLNITVGGNGTIGLAQSSATGYAGFSYSDFRSALLSNSPGDAADLPVTDPTINATNPTGGNFSFHTAQLKALGLTSLLGGGYSPTSTDGNVDFSTAVGWAFGTTPSGRMQPNQYDFMSSIEHEFSEIMGRVSGLDPQTTTSKDFSAFDLFRYSANGVRSFSSITSPVLTDSNGNPVYPNPIAYYSLDGGATNLRSFQDVTGDDIHDWAGANHDSFDAEGPTNDYEPVTALDLQAMYSVGYIPAPEPASASILIVGGLCMLGRRRRRAVRR